MIVMSGSMEPEIKTGSMCFVNTRFDYEKVKEGDIVTFDLSGTDVTHRAVRVFPEGMITKGDANEVNDPGIVLKDRFKGKVINAIPYIGYLFYFIRENMEFIFPVFILILVWLLLIKVLLKRKEEDFEKYNA